MSDATPLPHFALDTIAMPNGPKVAIALPNGRHIPLAATGARLGVAIGDVSLFQLLQTWDQSWPAIRGIAEAAAYNPDFAIGDARVVPAWSSARKVICAGANYYKHLAEMNVAFTKEPGRPPFFFLKPPTALVGPGRTVPLEPGIEQLDWEVEMTCVIGRAGRDIPVAQALDHVAGYTVSIDLTARDRLFNPDSIFKFDFLSGKGRDGFCPTATSMLPAAFLRDPQDAHLTLAVNGVTKQDASTSDMIFGCAELISWASRMFTLEPGDLLLTGSPHGVGAPRKEFLKVGDSIRCALAPLAPLDVTIYAKQASPL